MKRRYEVSSAEWRKAATDENFKPLHVEEGTLLLPQGNGTARVEVYVDDPDTARVLEEWYRQGGQVALRLQLEERQEEETLSGTLGFDGPQRPGLEYVRVEGDPEDLSFAG